MSGATPPPTFRDPAGSLAFRGDHAVRTIHSAAREEVLEFIASPLYLRLEERGDIVASTVEDSPEGLRLLHPRIPVPTYPWEWTPSQWLAAAELTLTLCEEALAEGWILKDATPLNILFVGSRPVLVDVISFEKRDPASSLWLAYAQYLRTFLLPLLMYRLLGWPLELSLFRRDGYEPSQVYQSLGWSQRLSRAAFWPITLPTMLEKRSAGGAPARPAPVKDPELSRYQIGRSLADLRKRTRRAMPAETASEWADYTGTLSHYTSAESAAKLAWVREVLAELAPATVLDVGANTGEFSALSAEMGAQVVALERDGPAAERLFRMSRDRGLAIQTIHADLSRPTPAVGWNNTESTALLPRLEGHAELVLLLAVIHHLVLLEQIPLAAILELCQRLTKRHLVVEWVPVSDPMFQSLMRGRDDLYGSLAEPDLMAACEGRFELRRRHVLENGRILFLFEKKTA